MSSPASITSPVAVPWSNGFEHQFCDYAQPRGFCYAFGHASYEIVTSPVHSGRYAAAFAIDSADSNSVQARCVRQGALPTVAYYGAWYYVPELAHSTQLWNLLHFQGGDPRVQHGLWDVSLVSGSAGDLELFVFDFLNGQMRVSPQPVPVPIGAWFHVQLYLKRAPDATGEVALYQDGQLLFDAPNLVTDDTTWGQWYVGNLANGLAPPASTLYVDDVTISGSL